MIIIGNFFPNERDERTRFNSRAGDRLLTGCSITKRVDLSYTCDGGLRRYTSSTVS